MRWAQGFSFPFILTGATALLAAGLAAAASAEPPENTAHTLPRAVAVSGGAHHTCALTEAGGVMCWGWNVAGQLGDGTTTDRLTPVAVKGLESGVKAIAAGIVYTCALLETGRVKCWGGNSDGELGDGTTTDRLRPVALNLSRVKAIAAGPGHTCALTAKAGLCWGDNSFGELGDGTTTDSSTPVRVRGFPR
jgi:alpha-tubulin suppressor-like RCC1 family protein